MFIEIASIFLAAVAILMPSAGDVTDSATTTPPICFSRPASIYVSGDSVVGGRLDGRRFRGVLVGTNKSDVIVAPSRSRIRGRGGDDFICGSFGNDVINAGAGNDQVSGGNNNVKGPDGDDRIYGGGGDDTIYAGGGNDRVFGNRGNDVLYGEDGNDDIKGGSGNDILCGMSGGDDLRGNGGDDKLDGGTDTNALRGGGGTDICLNGENKGGCEIVDADPDFCGDDVIQPDPTISVDFVSANAEVLAGDGPDDDIGTFTIVFDITAQGGTVFVGDTADPTTLSDSSILPPISNNGVLYRVYNSGVIATSTDDLADVVTFTTPAGVTDSTDNIEIENRATSRVTLIVTQTNNSPEDDGVYYVEIAAVAWGLADDGSYEFVYSGEKLDDFETPPIILN